METILKNEYLFYGYAMGWDMAKTFGPMEFVSKRFIGWPTAWSVEVLFRDYDKQRGHDAFLSSMERWTKGQLV